MANLAHVATKDNIVPVVLATDDQLSWSWGFILNLLCPSEIRECVVIVWIETTARNSSMGRQGQSDGSDVLDSHCSHMEADGVKVFR